MTVKARNKGFSVVELVIVLAIIAVLGSVATPLYLKYVEKSRATACLANMDSALTGYQVDCIDLLSQSSLKLDRALGTDAMLMSMEELGAVHIAGGANDNTLHFSGICPSDGEAICCVGQDGSLLITCTKHPANAVSDFIVTLTSSVFSRLTTLKREGVSLLSYLSRGSAIDSEAPAMIDDDTVSWTSIINNSLLNSAISDQSWVMLKEGDSFSIYITTGGKLTTDDISKKVNTVKYSFDSNGVYVGQAGSVTLSVGSGKTTPKYPILNPPSGS